MARYWVGDIDTHRPRPARRNINGGPDRCAVCGWVLIWLGPLDRRGDWLHDDRRERILR